jgi:4-hydroxybenzoate polyprenyltransferase
LEKNLGTSGRVLRLAVALLLLAYAYWQSSWIALALALFTFFEAWMSWCIFNQLFGINHCKKK